MKVLILTLFLSLTASAEVTLEDCLDDALTFASDDRPVSPLAECASIVRAEEDKIEASSGVYSAYGKKWILYIDTKDGAGNIIRRDLLSGDQTELVDIKKIFIDTAANRLFVIQTRAEKNELLVYKLDFIGNVTPMNVMRSEILFNNVSSVKMSSDKHIEIINSQGKFLINSDAESRTTRSVQKALIITAQ